ncbi:MAG: hypothetical protein A3I05_03600 [Deltaproteobacteria bacterium RIFCSPLOWO2_02_FULL_44_10]|nr:MAG: hypothetical protein A3C46_03170 [Deltaproteobacteria bacterium RIFCSPHIGHO2_02_FULL_44_16]OGQ46253.1 MAG: hypothetical protein A3I05_03600 [Deltaproteobacteria bacterium RIFCSPLOWO2_02_FULL_44_10]
MLSFAIRLADRLGLADHEARDLVLESTNSYISIRVGAVVRKNPHAMRSLRVEGILRWRGVEYDIAIEDHEGNGTLGKFDSAKLRDRSTGENIGGNLPQRIYAALIPLIELQAQDQLERARRKKH